MGSSAALIALCLMMVSGAIAASKYKVLHAFGKGKDGGGLYAGVTLGSQRKLFGTTSGGGAYNSGTVFELTPGTDGKWGEAILHSFCAPSDCIDGALPMAVLTLDAMGDLYGSSNIATFQMTPGSTAASGWSFQVLYGTGSYGYVVEQGWQPLRSMGTWEIWEGRRF